MYYWNGTKYTFTRSFRDVGTWMHIVFQNNTGTVTVWVNNNQVYILRLLVLHLIQLQMQPILDVIMVDGSGTHYFDGYIADYHFIDGLAKTDPTDFAAEYNGVWTPIAYSGTYPGSSVRLEFADASDLGNDTSGNNNDYLLGGITSEFKKIDSPTINMCAFHSFKLIRRDVPTHVYIIL